METKIHHKISVLLWMIFIILLVGLSLKAQRGPRPGMRTPRQECAQFSPTLDLSDQQKEQIRELQIERSSAINPLRNALRENMAEGYTLKHSEDYDREAVMANIDERTELQNKISKIHAAYYEKFRNLLTEDQKLILILKEDQGMYETHRYRRRNAFHQRFRMRGPERGPYHRFRSGTGEDM